MLIYFCLVNMDWVCLFDGICGECQTKSEKEGYFSMIENGDLNIIVGTHSLLGNRVVYNNLGLLVVDEEQVILSINSECSWCLDVHSSDCSCFCGSLVLDLYIVLFYVYWQRFGVKQKEKIASFKMSVDVLTLSATPIPRTLYLALTGFRDTR